MQLSFLFLNKKLHKKLLNLLNNHILKVKYMELMRTIINIYQITN